MHLVALLLLGCLVRSLHGAATDPTLRRWLQVDCGVGSYSEALCSVQLDASIVDYPDQGFVWQREYCSVNVSVPDPMVDDPEPVEDVDFQLLLSEYEYDLLVQEVLFTQQQNPLLPGEVAVIKCNPEVTEVACGENAEKAHRILMYNDSLVVTPIGCIYNAYALLSAHAAAVGVRSKLTMQSISSDIFVIPTPNNPNGSTAATGMSGGAVAAIIIVVFLVLFCGLFVGYSWKHDNALARALHLPLPRNPPQEPQAPLVKNTLANPGNAPIQQYDAPAAAPTGPNAFTVYGNDQQQQQQQAAAPSPAMSNGGGSAAPRLRCVALFDFQAEEDGDLPFTRGQVIDVLEQDGEWWRGSIDGGPAGIFPVNLVQPIAPPRPGQRVDTQASEALAANPANQAAPTLPSSMRPYHRPGLTKKQRKSAQKQSAGGTEEDFFGI